jgi:hypothetical protein
MISLKTVSPVSYFYLHLLPVVLFLVLEKYSVLGDTESMCMKSGKGKFSNCSKLNDGMISNDPKDVKFYLYSNKNVGNETM